MTTVLIIAIVLCLAVVGYFGVCWLTSTLDPPSALKSKATDSLEPRVRLGAESPRMLDALNWYLRKCAKGKTPIAVSCSCGKAAALRKRLIKDDVDVLLLKHDPAGRWASFWVSLEALERAAVGNQDPRTAPLIPRCGDSGFYAVWNAEVQCAERDALLNGLRNAISDALSEETMES